MAEQIEALICSQKQLVGDISHELRSPLARLNVALGLARREAAPASEAALDRIELESERLNTMIGELLTLTMLESGRAATEIQLLDLAELVVEVAQDADFEAADSNRRVEAAVPASCMVHGNRELLRRALENVIRNAIRYTADGTAVEISLQTDAADSAVIRIRDHGPGVPEEELSDIFRPFYRVAKDRDRQSGGAGIGLAITERTMAVHGGSVSAANHRQGGLEITIRLPLCSRGE